MLPPPPQKYTWLTIYDTNTHNHTHTHTLLHANTQQTIYNALIHILYLTHSYKHMKFECKNRYINFYQFEIFAILKLLKNKENNKKICHMFHHTLKNIPCYVTSEGIIEKGFILLYLMMDLLKKWVFIGFCIQTIYVWHFPPPPPNTHTYTHTQIHNNQRCPNATNQVFINTFQYISITSYQSL